MRNRRLQPHVRARVERTLAAQALLAAIAERGADAVGYAYRAPGAAPIVVQAAHAAPAAPRADRGPGRRDASCSSTSATTRRATRRSPRTTTPSATGRSSGSTTGSSSTTTSCWRSTASCAREPRMTVDSEAIFALARRTRAATRARSRSSAARWRPPGSTSASPSCSSLARGAGRPLWLGTARRELFFASTRSGARDGRALRRVAAAQARGRRGHARSRSSGARVVRRERFRPRSGVEADPLPAVRAPHEREFCLERLAALAAAA